MIGPHFAAVKARIEEDAALAGNGYDTARLDGDGKPIRGTYFVLYGGGPDELDDQRLASTQRIDSDATFVYTVRSVSTDAATVRAMQTKVLTKLIGFIPTVANRVCSAMELTDSNDVEVDDNVTPPLFFADDEYELRSSRA